MATGFSAQNSGNRPRTVAVGGRNFQPDAGNPDLWPVFNDQGQQRINARIRPENTRLMGGGIDAFKLVNSPYGRQQGIGYKQAENAVGEMRRGMSDPNRPLFDLNPYSRGGGGGKRKGRVDQYGNRLAPMPVAQPAQAMENENGEPFNPENAPAVAQTAPAIAPAVSRFSPMAEEIAARRDFARGEAPVQFNNPMDNPNADEMNPQPMTAVKMNPYGSATATYGGSRKGGGVMPNPITGQMVPMNPYLKEQRSVQDTKFSPQTEGAKQVASQFSNTKPLDAAKGAYFRNKVRGTA